ncbi:hypothetical protein SCAR479_04451 [Seiridium cardinale]|uniref:Small EDRK-rich factor-like N-terminal domain-containing protein n=1 Tax=Seiridium cardinale TaxID=138064 RepID=A0ABR2XYI7_9PEZI
MARGNQRDKAREKNLKQQASMKSKNSKSGSEMQRDKDAVAAIMKQKQAAGKHSTTTSPLYASTGPVD